MIYVYVLSIVLVAILIILFFMLIQKKSDKNINNFKNEKYKNQTNEVKQQNIEEEKKQTKKISPDLEDFVWDKEEQKKEERPVEAPPVDDYEKFLKENNIDVDDEDDYDEDDEFDFNELIGKTNEEIAEIIKKYPPEIQEIVMNELNNNEDE